MDISLHAVPRFPLFLEAQERLDSWRQLGTSDYLARGIQIRLLEAPVKPFRGGEGKDLEYIPQSSGDRAFALEDLYEVFLNGIYREVPKGHVMRSKKMGAIISSAFTTLQEKDRGKNGRFFVNLSLPYTHWYRGTVRIELIADFSMSVQWVDNFLSIDISNGYRHLRLHQAMWDWVIPSVCARPVALEECGH